MATKDIQDISEDVGQYEPLTTRLKNILGDYKDGLTIIKELLQNADDAKATEVNICYDTRQHEKNPSELDFSGMSEAHGPALIVYNNSTFSDEDFENITKLAGATKRGKGNKIGKYGLGFCSVYHMTDVPSFVSREYLYIFDPTLSYLKKEVKNPARPGKKLKFPLSGSKQLEPYNGLFGFNPAQSYQGTMFRLPFRTHASELSETCYTEATVRELMIAIRDSSHSLLLFLRNVKTITLQRINPDKQVPDILLRISRESIPLPTTLPLGVEVRSLSCNKPQVRSSRCCHWLVSHLNETSNRQYYTASVACPLGSPGSYKVDTSFSGEIFCFLPLAQKTGLPVHVSSNFAVISNRRGIWTSTSTITAISRTNTEVRWNLSLMQGVIPKAYYGLLQALKMLASSTLLQNYVFHSLWPLKENLLQQNPWRNMISQLYHLIVSDQLFYSDHFQQWLCISESRFLTPGIFCQSFKQSSTPQCVLNVLKHLKIPIVNLPTKFYPCLSLNTHNQRQVIIDEPTFAKLFFDNLKSLESTFNTRSDVVQYMLEVYAAEYDDKTDRSCLLHEYFTKHAFVPSSDGKVLKKCTEIVDPSAEFGPLFDPSENHFPISQLTERHLSHTALIELGMINESLPYHMLVERAQTVVELYKSDKKKALARIKLIFSALKKCELPKEGGGLSLSSIPFLPVLSKPPPKYHLPWKGSGCELMCPKDLMTVGYNHKKRYDLVGSQVAFVNEDKIEDGGCGIVRYEVIQILEVRTSPKLDEVLCELAEVQRVFESFQSPTEHDIKNTDRICSNIYEFVDNKLKQKITLPTVDGPFTPLLPNVKASHSISCVWNGKKFLKIESIAKEWSINGPYLYPWPACISSREYMIISLRLKLHFNFEDIQKTFEEMKSNFQDTPVDKDCKNILTDIVSLLQKISLPPADQQSTILMLPDEKFILYPSNKLNYNDVDWAPKDTNYIYVNDIVPHSLAKRLGITPVRNKILEKYVTSSESFGLEFGQHEELTLRIQNILRDYPLDITLLKELLQNADDAKATKMYVILDKRTHGKHAMLSDNWGKLQGPALLVWNDSVFNEADLEGIQKLGLGSKRLNSESIGQYGIGFNVVYHLTDCPSFITGGDTLCVFDPHCNYVSEANKLSPGRRFIVNEEFWDDFYDMGSTYLRSGLEQCPPEINGGSLFRFPLRYTYEHLKTSKIVTKDDQGEPMGSPLTSLKMYELLELWAPQIKEMMIFLNHVLELQFMVIEENSREIASLHKYSITVDTLAQKSRIKFTEAISSFKKTGTNPVLVRYPLTITDTSVDTEQSIQFINEENWLVQQGIGDIQLKEQTWNLIDKMKPRHGIAVPLHKCTHFYGKLFCFLPLQVLTKLPVYINGHFVLDSSRRNLWSSYEKNDDKLNWNHRLFQAIASSYADFVENAKDFFVPSQLFNELKDAEDAVNNYYKIFPSTSSLSDRYKILAKNFYSNLIQKNSRILAVIEHEENTSENLTFRVKWYPLKSNPQVYFNSFLNEHNDIQTIAERFGMKLTVASSTLQDNLNSVIENPEDTIKSTCPETVFTTYTAVYSSMSNFPSPIENTVFKNVSAFKRFTEYVLGLLDTADLHTNSDDDPESMTYYHKFPREPFSCPLLLTADNKLRKFQRDAKVIRSFFSQLFQAALEYFLHPDLIDIHYHPSYFLAPSSPSGDNTYDEYSVQLVNKIFSQQFPSTMQTIKLEQLPEELTSDDLVFLWKCLSTDEIFMQHRLELLESWTLLPDIKGCLYSSGKHLVPVWPIEGDEEVDERHTMMFNLLQKAKMPVLDTSIVSCDRTLMPCPDIQNETSILKALYYLNKQLTLEFTKEEAELTLKYLSTKINFQLSDSENPTIQACIKSLPLFKCIDGTLTAIYNVPTFEWPSNAILSHNFLVWLQETSQEVIFLNHTPQIEQSNYLGISIITEEELYCDYIFESFSSLSEEERFTHLCHIKDCVYPLMKAKLNSATSDSNKASTFIHNLTNTPCIGVDGQSLRPIKDYCNHKIVIFTVFEHEYQFLPDVFTKLDDEEHDNWLNFFKQLGLKHTIDKEEFLSFCDASRNCESAEYSSTVLLRYLFSDSAKEVSWHTDVEFLSNVASIPFIPTAPLPEVTWLHDPVNPKPEQQLVTLRDSAVFECHIELWTVKPIIRLPTDNWQSYSELVEGLGVTYKPQIEEVLQNLLNICSCGKYTDSQLFWNYSNVPHSNGLPLLEVVSHILNFLSENPLSEENFALLKDMPCIPVHTAARDNSRMVLVKPNHVLTDVSDAEIQQFFPFLHSLAPELMKIGHLLRKIGTEPTLRLSHLQLVLEQAHTWSPDQELQPETTKCIAAALARLYHMLLNPLQLPSPSNDLSKSASEKKLVAAISPLYLPNHNKKLALSKTLLYIDRDILDGITPQLDGSGYSLFRMPESQIKLPSGKAFCEQLPEELRPSALSKICSISIADDCKTVAPNAIGRYMKITFSMSKLLSEAVAAFVTKYDVSEEIVTVVDSFLSNVEVASFEELLLVVTIRETGQVIGTVHTKSYLKLSAIGGTICLDSQIHTATKIRANLADHLLSQVKARIPNIPKEIFDSFGALLSDLLGSQTSYQVEEFLKNHGVQIETSAWKQTVENAMSITPDPEQARIWLSQAEANFTSLVLLNAATQGGQNQEVCADVCFMAHQVAEKALKGGYHIIGRVIDRSHSLKLLAKTLKQLCPDIMEGLISHSQVLEEYYLEPRYPDMWTPPTIPATMYGKEKAKEAIEHARAILDTIKKLVS